MTRRWFQTFFMFTLTWMKCSNFTDTVFFTKWIEIRAFWGPGTFQQFFVFFNDVFSVWRLVFLFLYNPCMVYFTTFGCFFYGKCIGGTYDYHTWMLWVYGKKAHVTLILLSPSPNVSWVLGGGMARWWFQILSMLNRSLWGEIWWKIWWADTWLERVDTTNLYL